VGGITHLKLGGGRLPPGPASSTAAASGTATAGAGHPAPVAGLTHVIAYSINTDNPVLTSVVSGAIGDDGPAEEVSPGSTGVSAHGSQLELKLIRGTFRPRRT